MPNNPLALLEQSGAYTYKGRLYLPAFTSLGSYTLIYLTKGMDVLCAECATIDYFEWLYTLTVSGDADVAPWMYDPPVHVSTYDEGPDEICAGCNKAIASTYGDPDADDSEELGDPRPPENLPYIER